MKLAVLRGPRKVNRSAAGNFFLFAFLAVAGAFSAIPLVYAINAAFKPLDEIFLFPPRMFVRNPTLQNFADLVNLLGQSWVPFTRYIFNTVFITLVGVIGHVLFASMAGYALAKHNFPGRRVLFQIVVLSLMFAWQGTAVPNYMIMAKLGLVDTYWAVILPAFAYSLGLYLMKQFMEQIPDALLEAAKIDGASEYRIFWSVVMPNVKPAWMTLIILLFQFLWGTDGNGFIYSEQLKTLHYASNQIIQGGIARAGAASAVALILMSVPITIFIFSQSQIIETMAPSGMKD